jgi:hypothetical protein
MFPKKAVAFPVYPKGLTVQNSANSAQSLKLWQHESPRDGWNQESSRKKKHCQAHPETYSEAPNVMSETRDSATSRDSATQKA